MKEKTIERIEELNWSVREYEDNYMFETWSPAGENIVVDVPQKTSYKKCANTQLDST